MKIIVKRIGFVAGLSSGQMCAAQYLFNEAILRSQSQDSWLNVSETGGDAHV